MSAVVWLKIDPRSLSVFRVLLSIYVLWDIAGRLSLGRASLAWYTSDDTGGTSYASIQDPRDTPHGSKIHQLWFHRGSEDFQIANFSVTVLLALVFGVGYRVHSGSLVSLLLWLSVTAIQNRCTQVNDGSDRFLRCLLLWCIFLPMNQVWSLDGRDIKTRSSWAVDVNSKKYDMPAKEAAKGEGSQLLSQKEVSDSTSVSNKSNEHCLTRTRRYEPISSAASTGLLLQIVLMYLGTVLNRFPGTAWFPPSLEAVHYAINSTFASRSWSANFLRSHPSLARAMTFQAMVIEGLCPLACLVASYNDQSWRHIPAIMIASLHFGLLISMRLPQWQTLGLICTIIWFPPHVWDRIEAAAEIFFFKKHPKQQRISSMTLSPTPLYSKFHKTVKNVVSAFLLVYMIYNFSGERGWISKHDNGDIGEAIQFSQRWVMYGPDPPTTCIVTVMAGTVVVDGLTNESDPMYIDLLASLRTQKATFIEQETLESLLHDPPVDMSEQFPSWRWENALNKWSKQGERRLNKAVNLESRLHRLSRFLCAFGDEKLEELSSVYANTLAEITINIRHLQIMEPGHPERFSSIHGSEMEVRTPCR
jgi:hypothetical protein